MSHGHRQCLSHAKSTERKSGQHVRNQPQQIYTTMKSSNNDSNTDKENKDGDTRNASSNEDTKGALSPKDEIKVLKNWGFLKKNLIMNNIIDPLIEKGIYSPNEWIAMKRKKTTEQEKVEEFLYHLLSLKPEVYEIFVECLKVKGYGHVVSLLEGTESEAKSSQRISYSGSSLSGNSRVGRPNTIARTFSLQYQSPSVSVSDPRNGASGSEQTVSAGSASSSKTDQTVRQEDLNRMKEEITEELRQLRKNIEKDRDDDRIELQILQRKHGEMSEHLKKANTDREKLEHELHTLNKTVGNLQEQIDKKSTEYEEIKKMNCKLKSQLDTKTGDLEKQIKEKEKEKVEMQQALRAKEIEYKRLQVVLETIKEEHEDRLTRLKTVNKDKVALEKQVQSLAKEKKNLEVKIKSLEQHIRLLQENFMRDKDNITLQLEKTKTLLQEKEKERTDLEKQLQESVRENENLKQKNLQLEESLQKTQDEKAHLQQKVHQTELSSYAIPPFLSGSKSNRPGWKPNHRRSNWR